MFDSDPKTRGHRGLIAVAIVVASTLALWVATVAIVRESANSRIADEIVRLRAAGAPLTPDALDGPRPSPHEDIVAALSPIRGELAKAFAGNAFALPTRGDVPADGGEAKFGARLAAMCAAERERIDACRRAADLPAAWMPSLHSHTGRADDFTVVSHAATALSTAALVEAWSGDGRAATADLARVLHIVSALDRQPAAINAHLQLELVGRVHDVLRATLVRPDAPREFAELDTPLVARDPWLIATRAASLERAAYVVLLTRTGLAPEPGLMVPLVAPPASGGVTRTFQRWFLWPSGNRMFVQWFDDLSQLEARGALGCPAYFRAPLAASTAPFGGARLFREAAAEIGRTTLARAALRARFENFATADAFLVAQVDPFTGGPIFSRVDADGSWVAWCSASPEAPAQASGPLPARDQNWRVARKP